MFTSLLYHAIRIRGYKYSRTEYRLQFNPGQLSRPSRPPLQVATHWHPSNVRSLCYPQ
jgi:hypothetical protein